MDRWWMDDFRFKFLTIHLPSNAGPPWVRADISVIPLAAITSEFGYAFFTSQKFLHGTLLLTCESEVILEVFSFHCYSFLLNSLNPLPPQDGLILSLGSPLSSSQLYPCHHIPDSNECHDKPDTPHTWKNPVHP